MLQKRQVTKNHDASSNESTKKEHKIQRANTKHGPHPWAQVLRLGDLQPTPKQCLAARNRGLVNRVDWLIISSNCGYVVFCEEPNV